jgi:hypothetical protein
VKARELFNRRVVLSQHAFVDLVAWEVPSPVRGSSHRFKYSLAFVVNGVCVLRYDNEAGKGDHKHLGDWEFPYEFSTPAQLVADFWSDVARWRDENRDV